MIGEPYENVADKEVQYIWTITPGKQVTVQFKKTTHHIIELSFAYSQVSNEVSVTIEKLFNSSLLAVGSPPGIIYENDNIWVNVPNPNYVSNASVKFWVDKAWISNNNVDPNIIALYRYKDGKWNKLSTEKLFEVETAIAYVAYTLGFGSVAVSGEKKIETTPTLIFTPTATPVQTPSPGPAEAPAPTTTTKPTHGFEAILILFSLSAISRLKSRKSKNS